MSQGAVSDEMEEEQDKRREGGRMERMDVWEEQTAARPRAEPSISHRREARRQVTAAAAGKLRDGLRLDNNKKN